MRRKKYALEQRSESLIVRRLQRSQPKRDYIIAMMKQERE